MSENLHHTKPIISAEEGWENMEHLLNLYLPVKKTSFLKHAIAYIGAGVLCLSFVFISITLNDAVIPAKHQEKAVPAFTQNTASVTTSDELNTSSQAVSANGRSFITASTPNSSLQINAIDIEERFLAKPIALQNRHSVILQNISHEESSLVTNYINAEKRFAAHTFAPVTLQALPACIDSVERNIAMHGDGAADASAAATLNKKQKQRWGIYAGIALNTSFNNSKTNLLPYPIAEFKYHIDRKLYVTAGGSIFSPVTKGISGVSKSVAVNDSSNNILYYHELTNYKHLKYADIPVSIGWQVSKKWSVQTGIQLSVLMYKKASKTTELLDYQLNSIERQYYIPVTVAAAPNSQTYPVKAPALDYRAVTSVQYNFNRGQVGVSWQYGLRNTRPVFPVSSGRNQLLSVHALFRLNGSGH
jgi:hypothetical protein